MTIVNCQDSGWIVINVQDCPKPPLPHGRCCCWNGWSMVGVIHHVFLRRGETITADRYSDEIHEMHCKLVHKHPAIISRHGVLMLHDNARPHVAQRTVQTLHELQYEPLPHPRIPPDLSLPLTTTSSGISITSWQERPSLMVGRCNMEVIISSYCTLLISTFSNLTQAQVQYSPPNLD